MDRGHRLPAHGAVGQRDGEGRRGPADLSRRSGERRRSDVPRDDACAASSATTTSSIRCRRATTTAFTPRSPARRWPSARCRFLPDENRDGFDEGKAFVEKMLNYATAEKDKIVAEARGRGAEVVRGAQPALQERGRPHRTDPDEKKPPRHVGLDHVDEGQLKVREQDEWIWQRALERYEPMVQSVYDGAGPEARLERRPQAADAREGQCELDGRTSRILHGRRAGSTRREGRSRACSARIGVPRRRRATDDPYRPARRPRPAGGSAWRSGSPIRATRSRRGRSSTASGSIISASRSPATRTTSA